MLVRVHIPAMLLALLAGVFPALVIGQEAPLADPPSEQSVESTENKVESLNDGLRKLDKLMTLLKELGDPAKRQPDESGPEYLKRVDRVLKARAVVVGLVGQQVKRLLVAKHQLAEDLREYEIWAKEIDRQLKVLPDKYRAEVQKLEDEYDRRRPQVVVLAKLLYDKLPATAKMPEESDEAADLKAYFSAKNESGHSLLETLPGRAALEAELGKLSPEEQRRQLEDNISKMVDIDYEVELLNSSVILETEAFRDFLPKAHREVVKGAADLLNTKEMKALDDMAAQVSVIAKYTARNLVLVQERTPAGMFKAVPELQTNLGQIDKTMGELAAGKVTVSGRPHIMNRRSLSPGERNRPPQSSPPAPAK